MKTIEDIRDTAFNNGHIIWGLSGIHGSGKTTLSGQLKTILESRGKSVYQIFSKGSKVFKELGINPNTSLSPSTRLDIQFKILQEFAKDLQEIVQTASQPSIILSDRTPLDYLTYTVLDMNSQWAVQDFAKFQNYFEMCKSALNCYSDIIITNPEFAKSFTEVREFKHANNLAVNYQFVLIFNAILHSPDLRVHKLAFNYYRESDKYCANASQYTATDLLSVLERPFNILEILGRNYNLDF